MPTSQHIEIEGIDGQLSARLERPAGTPRAWALFAHCFTCTKDSLAARGITQALAARGIATVRFDFTGLGGSDGDFGSTNFASNIEDLLLVSEHMTASLGAPALLIGHSFGGAAVLAAAGGIPQAKAVVTLGAPCDPGHIKHLIGAEDQAALEQQGRAPVEIAGRTFHLRKCFLDHLDDAASQQAIGALDRPLLVLHAPDDDVVAFAHAERIYDAAAQPKSLVSLEGADHLLTDKADAAWVADLIAAWSIRHLPAEDLPAPQPAASEHAVVVEESGVGRFQQHVQAGPHRFLGDEPESVGGTDTGPSPYQLLLAALGTCTSMTMRMYADRKQWPLDKVSVALDHAKVHATDCADCETQQGKVDVIDRLITIEGDLDQAQRDRLIEIADKCPVHRTLHSEIKVKTTQGA